MFVEKEPKSLAFEKKHGIRGTILLKKQRYAEFKCSIKCYLVCLRFILNLNSTIAMCDEYISEAVPNFYTYAYDGRGGSQGSAISDGGGDMYDNGNIVRRTNVLIIYAELI